MGMAGRTMRNMRIARLSSAEGGVSRGTGGKEGTRKYDMVSNKRGNEAEILEEKEEKARKSKGEGRR